MKTENHTVTIPIADYNELLSTQEFIGFKKLDEANSMYHDFNEFLRMKNPAVKNPLDKIEFCYKLKL